MEKEISLPSLEPMIGRVVRVYKSGPESRVGKLLAVNDDHLVLHTETEGVLYYFLRHIKSVSEDTKEIADFENGEEMEFPNDDSMQDLLENLIGRTVKVDRAGPESRTGRLLAVTYDHLTMETKEEGVLYVLLQHIKSISIEVQENKDENGEGKGEGEEREERDVHFVNEDGIDELLDALKYRWIKINRGGGEAIEGVLVDSSGDHLVLVVQQEVQRIPIFHIRNISVASKKVEEKKEEENKEESNGNGSESKLSSDDISYIEKMLSEKYKKRGSDRSSGSSSSRSSRGSDRRSGSRSSRSSRHSSSRSSRSSRRNSSSRSSRSSRRHSSSRSSRSSRRHSSSRSSRSSRHRSSNRSSRSSRNRSSSRSRHRSDRNSQRRAKKRNSKIKSKKRSKKRNSTRLTFFTR